MPTQRAQSPAQMTARPAPSPARAVAARGATARATAPRPRVAPAVQPRTRAAARTPYRPDRRGYPSRMSEARHLAHQIERTGLAVRVADARADLAAALRAVAAADAAGRRRTPS